MARRAVLLDLDGTLWDSWPFYSQLIALRSARSEQETRAALMGGTPIARLLRSAGVTQASFRAHCASGHAPRLYRGVIAALRRLRTQHVLLGAATNLPAWIAHPMLDATPICHLFDTVAVYGSAPRPKPAPDLLRYALAELTVQPRAAWYLGDTQADHAAASAAHVRFAWASYGYGENLSGIHAVIARASDSSSLATASPTTAKQAARLATESSRS